MKSAAKEDLVINRAINNLKSIFTHHGMVYEKTEQMFGLFHKKLMENFNGFRWSIVFKNHNKAKVFLALALLFKKFLWSLKLKGANITECQPYRTNARIIHGPY